MKHWESVTFIFLEPEHNWALTITSCIVPCKTVFYFETVLHSACSHPDSSRLDAVHLPCIILHALSSTVMYFSNNVVLLWLHTNSIEYLQTGINLTVTMYMHAILEIFDASKSLCMIMFKITCENIVSYTHEKSYRA